MRSFPWRDVMAFGLGKLRLPPDVFWMMTPRELAAAMVGFSGHTRAITPPTRARLNELLSQFPDKGQSDDRI